MSSEPLLESPDTGLPSETRPDSGLWRAAFALAGWVWRLWVGTLLCLNPLTGILVAGWLARWTQGRVLYGWWKSSPCRRRESFEAFRDRLGPDAPTTRPRWFLRESFDLDSVRAEVRRLNGDGERPGPLRRVVRWTLAPFRSLVLNLWLGILTLAATYLLIGWGSVLMEFSWEFGWLNSFNKGYEQSAIGPVTGVAGLLLFVAAMCYVPMALLHLCVTGDFRAFFDARFVTRLMRARLTAYLGLALLMLLVGLVLEVLKSAPVAFDGHHRFFDAMTDAQFGRWLQSYYTWGCFVLVLGLLLTRGVAAAVYRSAVLKVLRRGRVQARDLHPTLARWLTKSGHLPVALPPVPAPTLLHGGRVLGRRVYRAALYAALVLVWLLFGAKTYVGEFFNRHPFVGFVHHPTIGLPWFNSPIEGRLL